MDDRRRDRIRIIGIDSPEEGACGDREAAQQLAELVAGKAIT